jgi:metal-sulfur cluster biosynthetic enzyme
MDVDYKPRYQRVPNSPTLCRPPQEALSFVTTPSVLGQDAITDLTINVKSHMTGRSCMDKHRMQDEFKQTMMFTRIRREQVRVQRAKTWHKTNMNTSCVHQGYHQRQDYLRFGAIRQQS